MYLHHWGQKPHWKSNEKMIFRLLQRNELYHTAVWSGFRVVLQMYFGLVVICLKNPESRTQKTDKWCGIIFIHVWETNGGFYWCRVGLKRALLVGGIDLKAVSNLKKSPLAKPIYTEQFIIFNICWKVAREQWAASGETWSDAIHHGTTNT